MSANNGIYVLVTEDKAILREGDTHYQYLPKDTTVTAYRVAHISAIENFDYFEKHQPYNIGFYMNECWGKSTVYYDKDEAMKAAQFYHDLLNVCEYGINVIERPQYRFPTM